MDQKKLWKTLKEVGILDHLTCLLKNVYVGQLEYYMEKLTGSKLGKSPTRLHILTLFMLKKQGDSI